MRCTDLKLVLLLPEPLEAGLEVLRVDEWLAAAFDAVLPASTPATGEAVNILG